MCQSSIVEGFSNEISYYYSFQLPWIPYKNSFTWQLRHGTFQSFCGKEVDLRVLMYADNIGIFIKPTKDNVSTLAYTTLEKVFTVGSKTLSLLNR